MKVKRLHVMSNSHLDREHRHAFQETRIMLVHMIDELIEIMEKDTEYRYFTLDGQAIVLDDYLEVRPHMKERLKKLIKEGRILIGPWYSLVDCYSVNPESIIRNLLVGNRVCNEYGEPMKLGYSIFSFGQMAQLPQVYAGFGINDIVFYKGGSAKAFPKSEFTWRAPDGSEAFTTRLGKEKRWNFYFDFDIPVLLGGDAKKPGWQSKFTDKTKLCHMNDEKYVSTYGTELEPDIRIRKEKIEDAVNLVMELLKESGSEKVFLAFDGTDFTSPFKEIPEAIRLANELMAGKVELIHSNPIEYIKEVKEDLKDIPLVNYEGEMRFGPINHVHSETMGTNTEIKQAIFNAENTIINYAEPLSSLLTINGGKYEKDILDLAWKYLLAAHAHDSVHGSGDPKIKSDNLNRLEQVQEIADSLVRRSVEGLVTLMDTSSFENDDMIIAVFNTTSYVRSDVIKLTIDFPQEELVQDYWLEELPGERIETYQLSKKKFNLAMIHRKFRPKSIYSDRVEINAFVRDVPAMGYKLLKVKRVKGDAATSTNPFELGIFPYKPIAFEGNILDNGLLRVTINNNGSLNVYDYDTHKICEGLNSFYDIGSCGDFWVHREPHNNGIISSKGSCAKIELIKNSNLSATYRITVKMDIPEGLNDDRNTRSKHLIPTEIITDVTLNKNSKRIDFKTFLDNKCRDHMMVVSFPTGIQSEYAYWESPFEIRRREVDKFTNDYGKKGPELERQAIQNFIDVNDNKSGFSLFTKGIKEVGTTRENCAVINLTLFRAATGTFPIHNDLFISFEKESSQCLGPQNFEYSVYIHTGDVANGNAIEESRKYITPPLAVQTGIGEQGSIKGTTSFIKFAGNSLNLCTLKLSENGKGFILRLNNPGDAVVNEEIEFFNEISEVYLTNMKEDFLHPVKTNGRRIKVDVAPYKINTYYISFNNKKAFLL